MRSKLRWRFFSLPRTGELRSAREDARSHGHRYRLLQSTIVGLVILHLLCIPGVSYFTGGLDIAEMELITGPNELNHTLLILGVMSLVLPTAFFTALDRGALVDLTLPACSAEAEKYYRLGRAALSLRSIFDSPEIETVQAVALMGSYHSICSSRFTLESAWALVSLASKLAQSVS